MLKYVQYLNWFLNSCSSIPIANCFNLNMFVLMNTATKMQTYIRPMLFFRRLQGNQITLLDSNLFNDLTALKKL